MVYSCLACRTKEERGSVPVRDCLAYCSACRARISSIDYVHTCLGGRLCKKCWSAKQEATDQ